MGAFSISLIYTTKPDSSTSVTLARTGSASLVIDTAKKDTLHRIADSTVSAHDLENTNVLLAFERDGSFVLDVANDPSWLKLRLERFPGSFADRIVLWVDATMSPRSVLDAAV